MTSKTSHSCKSIICQNLTQLVLMHNCVRYVQCTGYVYIWNGLYNVFLQCISLMMNNLFEICHVTFNVFLILLFFRELPASLLPIYIGMYQSTLDAQFFYHNVVLEMR